VKDKDPWCPASDKLLQDIDEAMGAEKTELCARCKKPLPRDYCWSPGDGFDCPFPPRGLTVQDLWLRAYDLKQELDELATQLFHDHD
jgi:hypothetical protein